MARFGRVITAMVTPFDDEGALDLSAASDLARWLVDRGNEGLVIAGTTGESPTLSDAEKLDLLRAVRDAVSVPLVFGSGSNDTAHTAELTAAAAEAGADGVLVVTPYYNRPHQAGLEAHFRTAAAATDLPVMIYDIPFRTGRKVATETLLRLVADVENIVAVKDAAGDVAESARLIAEADDGFELYSGDDGLTLPLLSVGAVGVVGVATHWAADRYSDMISAHAKGEVEAARRINAELIASVDFESGDANPNPLPTKALLRHLGLAVGHCRPPMGSPPPDLEQRAAALAADLGLSA